ncbi:MAG: peptidoglycan-binding protein, partial [Gammaproteobacteria bacterium]|nr:peptidoglycan-binding protein [Gammaproteobacteria bacterium]
REQLARNDMRQLAQRITGRYHLEPLSSDETGAYVDHRLKVAGAIGPIFTPAAKRMLFRHSGGVPRMINVIADRALLGGYTGEAQQITPQLVREAVREVYDEPVAGFNWRRPWWAHPGGLLGAGIAGLLIVLASGFAGVQWLRANRAEAPVAVSVAPPPAAAPAAQSPPAPVNGSEVPPVPLGPLLDDSAGRTGTDIAFGELFRLWNVDLQGDSRRPCVQAEERGLHCLYQRGTLEQVRTLGRPVILTLRDTDSNPHQVVLTGIGERSAMLNINGAEYRVDSEELAQYWFGEYLLLWRPQTAAVNAFLPGMRDPGVRWLRDSLAVIQGSPVEPADSELYDENLASRVRDYQRDRQLPVDGIAGHATQAAINTEVSSGDMPRLAHSD